MKNPTTIEEIINWQKEYRVIETGKVTKGLNVNVAVEHSNGTWGTYDKSEVQELTPLSYEGKRIAIGDWILHLGKWFQVYGYTFRVNKFVLDTYEKGLFGKYLYIEDQEIHGHKTTKHDDEVEKAIKLLTEKRIIKDGKVIV